MYRIHPLTLLKAGIHKDVRLANQPHMTIHAYMEQLGKKIDYIKERLFEIQALLVIHYIELLHQKRLEWGWSSYIKRGWIMWEKEQAGACNKRNKRFA